MSSSTEKYDVFMSLGEDTRKEFTSHLYQALEKNQIKTYMDYSLLDRRGGEDTWPALSKAIDNSQVSIIVFSDSYATSKWCLEELVRILQRRKDHGQVVIPVFYKTDPSDIRNQRGTYGKAFNKYEVELGNIKDNQSFNRHRISNWRAALAEAANISGWDSKNYEDDAQLIENVVKDVSEKQNLRSSVELKGLVGTEEKCRTVELHMKNKVRVIGIWGMPGIGKTTIARVLFAKHFPKFDHVSFVANVKECSLDKLLSELLKKVVTGMTFDMSSLKSKKVFIVLDNVSTLDQLLLDLCKEFQGQNEDSKLIITTRNKQLLEGRVDFIHKVEKWDGPESEQLFRSEAFKETPVAKEYEKLIAKVLEYAGGEPLALKVLGSHLYSKDFLFWSSTLRKICEYPNKAIQDLLKVSYDGLDELEKKIFLDIAFFFNGEDKDHVTSILDACGFEASRGIEVLLDKALITISYSNIIEMHDLLQTLAFQIEGEECSKNLSGSPRRLRDVREVSAILANNKKGTDAIEGITLDLSQIKDLHLSADTFKKMKKLRFLKVYSPLGQSSGNVYLPRDLEPFSDKLRYLEWNGYPLESLPPTFCGKFLVEICMPRSHVRKLWEGKQELDNLEKINLRESKQLKVLPDLSLAPRLKWVDLSGCDSLRYLHSSLLSSDTLVTLILDGCTNLLSVKSTKHLKSLKNISVNGCSGLKEFAVSSELIENLDLSKAAVETLDTTLNLESLKLKHIPKVLSSLKSLTVLKVSNSGLVIDKDQLHALFNGLQCLQILYLTECSNLYELPRNIGTLSKLYELRFDGSSLKRLPASIKNLQELEILSLRNCRELLYIPELPPLIKELNAHNCHSLVSVFKSKAFAAKMMGKMKRISFENNLKLDDQSLMSSLHLTMLSAAFHNVLVRRYCSGDVYSFNYNSVEVCLPGSHVQRLRREFAYRTNMSSSITVKFSASPIFLGFIHYVVLTPSHGIKSHGAKILCKCHLSGGASATWQIKEICELISVNVYMWYDPYQCDFIRIHNEVEASIEFSVSTDTEEVDASVGIKECGVHLISVSELFSVLHELEIDADKIKDMKEEFEFDIGHSNVPMPASPPPKETKIEKSYEQKNETDIDGMKNTAYSHLPTTPPSANEESAEPPAEEEEHPHSMTSNKADPGGIIPSAIDTEVEKELRSLTLSEECVAMLGPFLTANPTMRLTKSRIFCRSAYECLWRFLHFVGSQPLSALLGDRRGDFTDFMDALNQFSFDHDWLNELMERVTSPSEESPPRVLERIVSRKQEISVEIEKLMLEMQSLEEQEFHIRSLLDIPLFRL